MTEIKNEWIYIILAIVLVVISVGIFKCEGFGDIAKGPSSGQPFFDELQRDTFARYCLNPDGDCGLGNKFCTCLDHNGCGWFAGNGYSKKYNYGDVLPCSRFGSKCGANAFN